MSSPNQQLYCARCGTPAIPGERFCGECGNNLTAPGSLKTTPGASPSPTAAPAGEPSRFDPPPTNIAASQQPGIPTQRMPQGGMPTGYQQVGYGQPPAAPPARKGSSPLPAIIGGVGLLAVAAILVVVFVVKPGGGSSSATATPSALALATATPGSLALATTAPNDSTVVPDRPTFVAISKATATWRVAGSTPASTRPTFVAISKATATSGSSTTDSGDGKSLVDGTARTMRAMSGYHLKINAMINSTATAGGQKLLIEGDFAKDKSQYDFAVGSQKVKARSLGTDTYLSLDDGTTWSKSDAGTGVEFFTQIFDRDTFAIGSDDKLEMIGEENIEGVSTRHVRVNSTGDRSLLGTGYTGTSDFWIADDSKYGDVAKRVDLDVNNSSDGSNTNISVIYSQYNKSFSVEKPTVK